MRLLNTRTLALEEFLGDNTPEYAILSHRWQVEEVTFQDLEAGIARSKKGYNKLYSTCIQAAEDGFQYVWSDTCCIDKTSSAELSETLNSMYDWYRNSAVCYGYMYDVEKVDDGFHKSVWFTRGWTLQELIAPPRMEFFNGDWQTLGTKRELQHVISGITGIDTRVLTGELEPQVFSVAQRMSWASKRTTAKVEDIAYSLLGIFGVNMTMLYGEGQNAFIRLQQKIMKQSDDHTLFAWKSSDPNHRGLFAKSPADFAESTKLIQSKDRWSRSPYSVTNMGLSIELPLAQWAMNTYLAALDCEIQGVSNSRVGIFLTALPEQNQFARVMLDGADLPYFGPTASEYRKVYIRQKIWGTQKRMDRMYGFWLRSFPAADSSPQAQFEVNCWNEWDHEKRLFTIPTGQRGTAGVIRYTMKKGHTTNLKLGFDGLFNPVCQWGGQLYSPAKFGARDRDTFQGRMAADWMGTKTDYRHVGNRLTGLLSDNGFYRILILDELVGDKRMWVVYIAEVEDGGWHRDCVCDGCDLTIFGTRYKCRVCDGFDYCFDCVKLAGKNHPGHTFEKIKLVRHPGVKCDSCALVVYGTRHKCSDCGDYDLCDYCFARADTVHPGHRFKSIKKPQ